MDRQQTRTLAGISLVLIGLIFILLEIILTAYYKVGLKDSFFTVLGTMFVFIVSGLVMMARMPKEVTNIEQLAETIIKRYISNS